MLKEFKPTILFLVKFALVFGLSSYFYGNFIKSFNQATPPKTDPITVIVAEHTQSLVHLLGFQTDLYPVADKPYLRMVHKNVPEGLRTAAILFFEGCNGVNIMILFCAFVIAFGGRLKDILWFLPSGIVIIHLFNLIRISSLSIVGLYSEGAFHFFHKYAFTAIIYGFVFLLWTWWVTRFIRIQKKQSNGKENAKA